MNRNELTILPLQMAPSVFNILATVNTLPYARCFLEIKRICSNHAKFQLWHEYILPKFIFCVYFWW